MRMLHVINPLRSTFVLGQVQSPGPKILDVGCGGGILAETLARSGAKVTAIDLSGPTLEVAKWHALTHGLKIDYHCMSVQEIVDEHEGTFDAVTCMEMLEHVPEPSAIIEACARVLKPGGQAIFSTIDRSIKAFLYAIFAGEYVFRILPVGTHHYQKLIRPREMIEWAQSSGLTPTAFASLLYNPLMRRFRVAEGKMDVNYMVCFRKKM